MNEKDTSFQAKTFHFDTEVTVSFTDQTVTAKDKAGSTSIDSQNLDSFAYSEFWEGRVSPAGLWFRLLTVSVIIVILGEIVFGGWSIASWVIFGVLIVVNFLYFFLFFFDSMLDMNIIRWIIKKFFSNHLYAVSIGNKSGNNIDFYAFLDEHSKVKEVENQLTMLKKFVEIKNDNKLNSTTSNSNKSTNLDELKKLGELFKSGIISEEEFNTKKKELLK